MAESWGKVFFQGVKSEKNGDFHPHTSHYKKNFQKIKNLRFERRQWFHWKELKKLYEINMNFVAESLLFGFYFIFCKKHYFFYVFSI